MTSGRLVSQKATLARLGFADPPRAVQHLGDPALAGLVDPLDDLFSDGLPDAHGIVADPDHARSSGGCARPRRDRLGEPPAGTLPTTARWPGCGPTDTCSDMVLQQLG